MLAAHLVRLGVAIFEGIEEGVRQKVGVARLGRGRSGCENRLEHVDRGEADGGEEHIELRELAEVLGGEGVPAVQKLRVRVRG